MAPSPVRKVVGVGLTRKVVHDHGTAADPAFTRADASVDTGYKVKACTGMRDRSCEVGDEPGRLVKVGAIESLGMENTILQDLGGNANAEPMCRRISAPECRGVGTTESFDMEDTILQDLGKLTQSRCAYSGMSWRLFSGFQTWFSCCKLWRYICWKLKS